ncbi:MAG: 30S ribosome-binding factor RbfA [Pirellulales bacterium]|nr:30S ribosome-binding factor RbfA [Pirellulales bacterium]
MPTQRRVQKVAEAIREIVSMAILAELKDPRIHDVTVTYVEVSADLRHAKVHVSVMGDDAQQRLTLRGLQSAAGFLQARLARELELRYTPKLTFLLDQGVKRSIEIARILKEVLPAEERPEEESDDIQNDEGQGNDEGRMTNDE